MAAPLIPVIMGLLRLAGYAISCYELYRVGVNFYAELDLQKKNMIKAKEEMKKIMKSLDFEISDKIDKKTEKAQIELLTEKDTRGSKTVNAQGRGSGITSVKTAIKQKIPFRPVISKICEVADQLPMAQLRERKGQKFEKVVPHSKMQTMMTLLSMTSNEFYGATIEEYIIVRLKQLATNFMIEFMDELLNWKSPLKAEVCFGFDSNTKKYLAPKLEGTTRLKRAGGDINPFWPMPHKGAGVIGADIIVPEYRGEPLTLTNIFALIEIKFQGDRITQKQFDQYNTLNIQVKNEKRLSGITVSEGFKLSLFRYPEDKSPEESNDKKEQSSSSNNRRKKS